MRALTITLLVLFGLIIGNKVGHEAALHSSACKMEPRQ